LPGRCWWSASGLSPEDHRRYGPLRPLDPRRRRSPPRPAPSHRALPAAGGPALRRLDVAVLGATLEAFVGLDPETVAGGERLSYTKDAAEAIALVDGGADGADAAFLLDATRREIIAVAAEGDVMPQKSTYIYPRPSPASS